MKKIILFCLLVSCSLFRAQVIGIDIDTSPSRSMNTGKDILSSMFARYKQGPCPSYIFSQRNTHYRNDSIVGHSEWHEFIEFPDKFRINFGDSTKGNFVIFKNDSAYNYRNFNLKSRRYDANTLLLLLGGMYYRPFDDVITRLQKENYNTAVLSTQKLGKESMYVIGAQKGDTLSNQVWVSKRDLRVVRIIEKMDADSWMDMTFDSYQKHCKGFVETKVTFKRNGKKEQVEEYYNIKDVPSFPESLFDPQKK
jgi:hypothetical protein